MNNTNEAPKFTRDRAVEIARMNAWMYNRHIKYLPKTFEEIEKWEPDEWVIQAILFTYFFENDNDVEQETVTVTSPSAEELFEEYVATLIEKNPDVQKLGDRLARWLDVDEFNNIEPILLGIAERIVNLEAENDKQSNLIVNDEAVEIALDAFLSKTGQEHPISELQRDLARPCIKAALEALA